MYRVAINSGPTVVSVSTPKSTQNSQARSDEADRIPVCSTSLYSRLLSAVTATTRARTGSRIELRRAPRTRNYGCAGDSSESTLSAGVRCDGKDFAEARIRHALARRLEEVNSIESVRNHIQARIGRGECGRGNLRPCDPASARCRKHDDRYSRCHSC